MKSFDSETVKKESLQQLATPMYHKKVSTCGLHMYPFSSPHGAISLRKFMPVLSYQTYKSVFYLDRKADRSTNVDNKADKMLSSFGLQCLCKINRGRQSRIKP